MPKQTEKLQKVLARLGLGSRRAMEKVIDEGRVVVNGKAATLGDRVDNDVSIKVDGKVVKAARQGSRKKRRVLIYHKPMAEICTRSDPEGRTTVFDKLPKLENDRWICVGRLDYNTTGLLIFTNDGEYANELMHPKTQIEREYAVRVYGDVTPEMLHNLREGVQLDDGMARFTDIKEGGGKGRNTWYYVLVTEGRNRLVRRLWESQDVTVSRLMRVRYGTIILPSRLKEGEWEELS